MASELPVKNLNQLEAVLEEYLVKKAPALPPNAKEAIVKYSPYIAIIIMILMLPLILSVLGLGALLTPLGYLAGVNVGFGYTLSMIVAVVVIGLEIKAIPGLFKRQQTAWRLMFYASLVGAISSLFQGNIVNALIGFLIGQYFLFQVKSLYTK